ncbi:MAG: hypothetical protein J6Y86_07425 [Pseudobutyrivibrio sp.]|nr:hypothetical protein [Pseudobutyrivibrio sp.]
MININPIQVLSMLMQFKQNPMGMLSQFGVPQNLSNDPQAVIQNMMNRGVISQDQYNQAMEMAKNMGAKF